MEEEHIQQMCEDVIRVKPDLVFTEKGISGGCARSRDARSYLVEADLVAPPPQTWPSTT